MKQQSQQFDYDINLNLQFQKKIFSKIYKVTEEEDQYLNQFFGSQEDFQQSSQKQKSQKEESLITHAALDERSVNNDHQLPSNRKMPKIRRQKSVFHNFQKHLIVTLKQQISMHLIQTQLEQVSPLAIKIWKKFKNTRKFSKQILMLLFGAQHYQHKLKCKIRKFLNASQQLSKTQIQMAQLQLRKIALQTLNRDHLFQCLAKRKMQGLTYFKIYMEQFMDQIKEGGIKRRLPKQKKGSLMLKQSNNSI